MERKLYQGLVGLVLLAFLVAVMASPGATRAATIFTVTSADDTDDGTCDAHCTLREAIIAANALAGADEIHFSIGGGGAQTIAVHSTGLGDLPTITDPLTIDAATQPGYVGAPLIELDGSALTSSAYGLEVGPGAPDSVIRGLVINGFMVISGGTSSAGVAVYGDGAIVEDNYIGTSQDGTAADPNRYNVRIVDASSTLVRNNLISGAATFGVYIGEADGTTVIDNLIGTDVSGTALLDNGIGLRVDSSTNVVIGEADHGNVMSDGVLVALTSLGAPSVNVSISDNFIGVDVTGTQRIGEGSINVTVGDAVISGNVISEQVDIGADASAIIADNMIGVNASGTGVFSTPPFNIGVDIASEGAGPASVVDGNVIGGHRIGVQVRGDRPGHVVRGNFIGTDPSGMLDLGNGSGVTVSGPSGVLIGGPTTSDGNLIAHSAGHGVTVATKPEAPTPGVRIRNNSIHSNGGIGIFTEWRELIPRPHINSLSPLAGTACPDCVVDIYSDDEDDGRTLEATVVADGGGNWSWAGVPAGPCIGVTATPQLGWTSEFTTLSLSGITDNHDGDFWEMFPLAYDDFTVPNSDEVTDDCDGDDDNDGLPDEVEVQALPCAAASGPLDPLKRDTDGDYIVDGMECAAGTNPLDPLSVDWPTVPGADADRDRVASGIEFLAGSSDKNSDSDGDGCRDAKEMASINGDRVVSSIDLSQVAMAFGDYDYPDPVYFFNFDYNKDGKISSLDLSQVALWFGAC